MREHGIEPAPERGKRTPWRTFLTAHWETVAATDFFTVEVATVRRLVTYYVLVVIELSSRKVQIAGITPRPDGGFMMQVGRNLTDPLDGFLRGKRFLILDRDQKFTMEFRLCLLFIHPPAPWVGSQPCGAKYPGFCADSKGV